MTESFTSATIKAVGDTDGPGEFEAILSTSTLDRDGEVIAGKAFDPLPASIPIYCEHDWKSGALPVGRGVPFYDDDDMVKLKGTFAITPRAQEVRSLVSDGIIDSMSVGFLNGKRETKSGVQTVTSGEMFEGSLTAIPINTTAKILAAKAYSEDRRTDRKAIDGSWEQRHSALFDAIRALYPSADWVETVATFDDRVIVEVHPDDRHYEIPYTFDGTEVTLGDPVEVEVTENIAVTPKHVSLDTDAEPAAKAAGPASDDVVRAKARIALLAATA